MPIGAADSIAGGFRDEMSFDTLRAHNAVHDRVIDALDSCARNCASKCASHPGCARNTIRPLVSLVEPVKPRRARGDTRPPILRARFRVQSASVSLSPARRGCSASPAGLVDDDEVAVEKTRSRSRAGCRYGASGARSSTTTTASRGARKAGSRQRSPFTVTRPSCTVPRARPRGARLLAHDRGDGRRLVCARAAKASRSASAPTRSWARASISPAAQDQPVPGRSDDDLVDADVRRWIRDEAHHAATSSILSIFAGPRRGGLGRAFCSGVTVSPDGWRSRGCRACLLDVDLVTSAHSACFC